MNAGRRHIRDYGWPQVERDLSDGIHPEVVAARIGLPVNDVLDTADLQGWPVTHKQLPTPSPDEVIDKYALLLGLDA